MRGLRFSLLITFIIWFINPSIDLVCPPRRELARKIQQHQDHSTVVGEGEISGDTRRLRKRIEDWRAQQRIFMPQVSSDVLRQHAEGLPAEKELLFLPSDYSKEQRAMLGLSYSADIESRLREGVAFDAIKSVQQYVKCLDELKFDKRLNAVGQDQNTRYNTQISRVASDRAAWIQHYNANRLSLMSLGSSSTARSFPILTLEDTQRRSASAKRALGDSQRFDGAIWGLGSKLSRHATVVEAGAGDYVPIPVAGDVSTQGAHKTLSESSMKPGTRR